MFYQTDETSVTANLFQDRFPEFDVYYRGTKLPKDETTKFASRILTEVLVKKIVSASKK